MTVLKNASLLYSTNADGVVEQIQHPVLAWREGLIKFVGAAEDLPESFKNDDVIDARGALVMPGLIDAHTHLAFGAWRSAEFSDRILGRSYQEINQSGGGIQSTVRATREASKEELKKRCFDHLEKMSRLGVTTVECKSGYGLNKEDEIKLLEVYQELNEEQKVDLVPTYLGAHLLPEGQSREDYLDLVINEMIPLVAEKKLARFVDVFVEEGAFTADEARAIHQATLKAGLKLKLHVDQLNDLSGGALAAELQAVSADHLEKISPDSLQALAQSKTVAVLLPLASLMTFQTPADGRALVEAGVTVALATDFNPGSAANYHLPLAMFLACCLNRLTPEEAFTAVTASAAAALDLQGRVGRLAPDHQADLMLVEADDLAHWLYHFRENACLMTIKDGQVIYDRDLKLNS